MIISKLKNISQSIADHYTIKYFLNPIRLSRLTFCMMLFMLSTIISEYIISKIDLHLENRKAQEHENYLLRKQKHKTIIEDINSLHLYLTNIDLKSRQEIISFLVTLDTKEITLLNDSMKILADDVIINYCREKNCWYMQQQKNSLPVYLLNKEFFENASQYKKDKKQNIYKVDQDLTLSILSADSEYSIRKYDQNSIVIHYPNISTDYGDGVWFTISIRDNTENTVKTNYETQKSLVMYDHKNKLKGDHIIDIPNGTIFEVKAFHRQKQNTILLEPAKQIFFKRNVNN